MARRSYDYDADYWAPGRVQWEARAHEAKDEANRVGRINFDKLFQMITEQQSQLEDQSRKLAELESRSIAHGELIHQQLPSERQFREELQAHGEVAFGETEMLRDAMNERIDELHDLMHVFDDRFDKLEEAAHEDHNGPVEHVNHSYGNTCYGWAPPGPPLVSALSPAHGVTEAPEPPPPLQPLTRLDEARAAPLHAPPLLPAPEPAEQPEDGLICDTWMPGHKLFNILHPLGLPPPPPRNGVCQHAKPEWFTEYFDRNSVESQTYFANVRDVRDVHGPNWANPLQSQCQSARDTFQLPYDAVHGNTLYPMMQERPNIFVSWHNASSGSYYLRIGCADCSMATDFYQPQNEVANSIPGQFSPKELKGHPIVQKAFRAFLALILEEPDLYGREACRHLHVDAPPLEIAWS